MKTVYGVYFYGPLYSSERIVTDVPLGTVDSSNESIIKLVKQFLPKAMDIKPTHGVIKELYLDNNDRVKIEKPAKLGAEKFQAFMLDGKGIEIIADTTSGNRDWFVNQRLINLPSTLYDMTIVKIDE